jgi:4-hydroxyphenylpyruvate dioxygenase-like putative hemolysin
MRLDHIAYRVKDRNASAKFYQDQFGYTIGTEFDVNFDNGSSAKCKVLVAPLIEVTLVHDGPEIFISDGTPGSIVGDWVAERNGEGGIHHMAYRVKDIDKIVVEWKNKGIEFLTEDIIDCPEDSLRQIFTRPLSHLGGTIIELIERGDKGFCQNSVKRLMESTVGN